MSTKQKEKGMRYADTVADARWDGGAVKERTEPHDGYFSVMLDTGWGLGVDAQFSDRVKVGDRFETAGSLGFPVQGVRVNGYVLWFKDSATMKEEARNWMTPAAALAKWDAGESVWSVEMGGLGPGYEQAIQILIWEIVRDAPPLPTPDAADRVSLSGWAEEAVKRCDRPCLGFSGAQVGAAKSVAYRFLRYGYTETLEAVDSDRKIQVSRDFPQPPPGAPAATRDGEGG